jgi:dipeptidyl aminopeptidase/acylaminoacyl peptidase
MSFTAADFVAVPRLAGFALSPDGTRLVTTRSTLDKAGTALRSELVDVDPADPREVRASVPGDHADSLPVFASDGSLLHLSDRPTPEGAEGSTLWRQRRPGEEPVAVVTVPGGILGVVAASAAPVVVIKALLHPAASDLADDARIEAERSDQSRALAFDDYPMRWWDSWLGPRNPRFLAVNLETGAVTDLTGDRGDALWDVYGHGFDITPDGATVVANLRRHDAPGSVAFDLVAIADGELRTLATGGEHCMATVSPDGRYAAAVRRDLSDPSAAEVWSLLCVDLTDGSVLNLTDGWDRYPMFPVWLPDSSGLLVMADDHGEQPVFRVSLEGGTPQRVTATGSFDSLTPTADGACFAVRTSVVEPWTAVRIDLASGDVAPLPFTTAPDLPGRVERVTTTVSDGSTVESWLVLPPGASAANPAPLATWFHGGPAGTWSRWDTRWSPHVFADAGWAMLLPDVAQSIGYGGAFQGRDRGDWRGAPVSDALEVVAAVAARADIAGDRLIAGGGSFGGYLTNALAVRADHPFRALVTACSIWSLDQHTGTSDAGFWAQHEFGTGPDGRARILASSPHLRADELHTPMLVIHGERDMRVSADQALRLWHDLRSRDVPGRLLVFPDEGHHIPSRPANIVRVYEEILAFADRYCD